MKKKCISVLLAVALTASLAACGGSASGDASTTASSGETGTEASADTSASADATETEAGGAFDQTYNWSFSTTYAGSSVVVQMYNRFAELCNEYTDGAITISVFPDGTVASEDDALAQVSSGELEFCGTGTAPIFTYSQADGWLNSPFMVTDLQTYKNVYDSDYWRAIRDSWATEHNVKDLCGPFYRGMRTVVSVKEIHSAADLSGLKLRMNSSKLWNDAWQACGATTVPIALSELYSSFQTGVVEACENPLSESGNLNIPEVAKYVVPTNHVAECAGIFMANDLYESLPDNYKEAVYKAGVDAMEECTPLIEDEEAEWLQKYLDAGSTYIDDLDIESFRAASEEYWKEMFATEWNNISYEDCMALIEECAK